LSQGFRQLKNKGVRRFGLHTMVASNELNPDYFVETARILFETVRDLSKELGINFEFVNLGGGIGTPYKPEQKPVDLSRVSSGISEAYDELIRKEDLHPLRVVMENGRMITGPHGFLVSKVLHVTKKYKDYVGLDACMADLMRPALYGAHHEITVLGKENSERDHIYDVTGSLCENNDKFAINRPLPEISEGDIVVIHNTGAHGYAMGSNYNGKLRSPEILFREDEAIERIRRAETLGDYFRTLDFKDSRFSKISS
jgi:diaminopimelate decarboxylase